MRISDWSSDVCSSDFFRGDVVLPVHELLGPRLRHRRWRRANISAATVAMEDEGRRAGRLRLRGEARCPGRGPACINSVGQRLQIGRPSCGGRECKSVEISGGALYIKKKTTKH